MKGAIKIQKATGTMSDPVFNSGADETSASQSGIRFMLQWLESPPAANPTEELPSLRLHLRALRDLAPAPLQRASLLDCLYLRSFSAIASIIPSLTHPVLPVTGNSRRTVRNVLELLQALGDELVFIQQIINHKPGATDPREAIRATIPGPLAAVASDIRQSEGFASRQRCAARDCQHLAPSVPRRHFARMCATRVIDGTRSDVPVGLFSALY
jgi:hypothetical protein